MTIDLFVDGLPKPQQRPRAFAFKGRARVYDAATAEGWKAAIAVALKPWAGQRHAGPVLVELDFCFVRPPTHFTKKGALTSSAPQFPGGRCGDVDNLFKAVADCGTEIGIWADDTQIVDATITKHYADRQGCQIHIEITDVDQGGFVLRPSAA